MLLFSGFATGISPGFWPEGGSSSGVTVQVTVPLRAEEYKSIKYK